MVLISFILGGISIFFIYLNNGNQCFLTYKQCELISYILFLFIPIFVFSLLICFSRIEVFNFWKKFTLFCLFFYFIFSLIFIIYKSFQKQ